MEKLHEYRKIIKIRCESINEGQNNNYFTFEVKFEQLRSHQLFKYSVVKHKEEVIQLYQKMELVIFDLTNPFGSLVNYGQKLFSIVNESLNECTKRLDIITNKHFVTFFSINLHYDDFINCLNYDQKKSEKNKDNKKDEIETLIAVNKGIFDTQRIRLKQREQNKLKQKHKLTQNALEFARPQKQKNMSEFQNMISLVHYQQDCDIELEQTQILDFIFMRYYQKQLLYMLEQPKKGIKIKNFLKNIFTQSKIQMGSLSILRKEDNKFTKVQSTELLAEPISMKFNQKTNMVFICTQVGVYIYFSKVQKKLEQIQIFAYVQLTRTVGFTANTCRAQLYLLSQTDKNELYVYSINRQELKKTQFSYKRANAICYQDSNSRLFVADIDSVQIYSVISFLEIKKLHQVKVEVNYQKIFQNLGYLFCLSEKGLLTVIELKPQGKEQLISVTTSIDLPEGTTQLVGSKKNKRLIVTLYRNCVVLIDTIEGPLYSLELNVGSKLQSLYSDYEKGEILVISPEGHLTILKLNEFVI